MFHGLNIAHKFSFAIREVKFAKFLQFTLNCTRQTSFLAIALHRKRHCHFIHYNSSGPCQPLQHRTTEQQEPNPRPCPSCRSCASAGVASPSELCTSAPAASPSELCSCSLSIWSTGGGIARGSEEGAVAALQGAVRRGSGAVRRGPWRWEGRRRWEEEAASLEGGGVARRGCGSVGNRD
jgi:hypothetical protein